LLHAADMQLGSEEAVRSKGAAPAPRPARMWTVQAHNRISGSAEDGVRVIVPAGRYILREIDEITYELQDSIAPPLLTLRLTEVAAYCKSGDLHIDGLWP
jgi:hypothetical protein